MGSNASAPKKSYNFKMEDDGVSEEVASDLLHHGINIEPNYVFSTNNDPEQYKFQLMKNEKYIKHLENKLKDKQHKAQNSNVISKEIFHKMLTQFDENFNFTKDKTFCENEKRNVFECYQNNEGRILECAKQAKLFESCVINIQHLLN